MTLHGSRFDQLVGVSAPRVRKHVIWSLKTGTQEAVDAYEFSKYSDGHTFGTNRWRFTVGALKDQDQLEALPEAKPLRVRSTFMLGVGNAILYPVCYASDSTTDVRGMKIRTSQIRTEMFAAYGQLAPQVQTALRISDGIDGQEWAFDDLEETLAELPEQPKMLLLAYASNREGGLLNCFVGEAKLDLSGSVSWEWIEPLAITDAEGGTGGISVVSPIDPSAPGFGTGAEPSINLEDADDTANESNEH
ncbi:hypothetical protein GTY87_18055 [Streptomyces sp. SID7813]|uniref:Uncharacterized protein n=1 Tax=Streptomyces coelicolor (strain ATCC BAA-471 / A3(2) / M145) TaxID=100226 RepID=Q9X8B3_STRCO|nr:hypothetical protein [Streptomyces sp. SID7813]QFI43568.1 hypothetical protein FQ762_18210 [Streptomyces coelicolor A3(2)]CAB41078.1 hypothetical protein [Streptomyces coelicolor A3(2)]